MRKALPSSWRFVLVWWLALLIPLQGLAASAGMHCVFTAAVVAIGETGAHPCDTHAESHEARHAMAHGAADQCAPASTDDSASAGHSCSACAACCAAAALPSHRPWAADPVQVDTASAEKPPRWTAVTQAGPERPPKHLID